MPLSILYEERNMKIYRKKIETPVQIANHIRDELKIALSTLKLVADDEVNRTLCEKWELHLFD